MIKNFNVFYLNLFPKGLLYLPFLSILYHNPINFSYRDIPNKSYRVIIKSNYICVWITAVCGGLSLSAVPVWFLHMAELRSSCQDFCLNLTEHSCNALFLCILKVWVYAKAKQQIIMQMISINKLQGCLNNQMNNEEI